MAEKKEKSHEKTISTLTFGLALGVFLILLIVYTVMNWELFKTKIIPVINANNIVLFGIFFTLAFLMTDIVRMVLSSKYPEIKKTLRVISTIFFILLMIVFSVLSSEDGTNYQTSLTVLISSIVLGTGWWIQATINAASARKSHTINTIMNQRHSVHYFNKLDNVYRHFGLTKTIPLHIAKQYRCGINGDDKVVKKELISACRDASYMLNYYEFISAGVLRGDFDENLILECFFDPMQNFENRAFYIIEVFQKEAGSNAGIFSNYIELLDRWMPDKSLTTRKKNGEVTHLHSNSHNEDDSYEDCMQENNDRNIDIENAYPTEAKPNHLNVVGDLEQQQTPP
ncbi:DUF4760 domain-containing protein [Pectobacterium aroidearum]|uniref:DUF4760 domain-containing protein n=1 Tax=Pectobacterium aroidearum TaxID=1201031 RepID=UPI0015E057DF|nr:DUF4760 domain-containing protein [Pectobacterium aroidearum]MBA0205005.1 DUF4760 domain-containing protein [Pectobacterium aroidearum]